jgi:hypothetical protein
MMPASISLPRLHHSIQGAMGWRNRHLHVFIIAGQRYGEPGGDYPDLNIVNQKSKPLSALIGGDVREFTYLYDFGDQWAASYGGRNAAISAPLLVRLTVRSWRARVPSGGCRRHECVPKISKRAI